MHLLTESGERSVDVGRERLRELMEAEPYSFQFFQLVRMLAKMHPERKPVGMFASPAEELVRFTAAPTLAFPPSQVSSYIHQEVEPDLLEVAFFGLNVVNGPMPRAYTETLLEHRRAKDTAALEFFDLFNHRIVSLFYRAWTRYRLFIAYEHNSSGDDEITERLYDLIGMGTPGLRNRMAIRDESAIFYAGLIAHRVRSSSALQQILEDYFGVRVMIRQFTGSWAPLPRDQRTVLREGTSMAECLGTGTVVGAEVWNQQGAFTVRLGPMPLARYQDFLPGARGQRELEAWLQLYTRRAFNIVVELVLNRDEVPKTTLQAGVARGSRLSYESWLKVKPMRRDPDETTYILQ